MTRPDALARHRHHQHLTAMLKASHAARLKRKGWPDSAVAKRIGYCDVATMNKAIRKYTKSPAPTGIGNGADQNTHQ